MSKTSLTHTKTADEPMRRRSFVAATAVVGSFAAAAALWASRKPALEVAKAASPKAVEPQAEGYRLSEHVKRYYQTTTL
jgi:hypothetical protein